MAEPMRQLLADGIRVLIVDDHPMLRDGIRGVIDRQADMTVIGEAGSGEDGVRLAGELAPDVIIMDIQMPGMDGIAAIGAIRRAHPQTAILVLTTYPGDRQAFRALKAGASGYMLKSCIRSELIDAIRAVRDGLRPIDEEVGFDEQNPRREPVLTEREIEVLRLVADGHPNKQIARLLSVSVDTVKVHLKHIFEKLGAADRTYAVMVAIRLGLIQV